MHAIEVGALRRKVFRNVLVVANVVKVGWGGKARGQQELAIKLGDSILTTCIVLLTYSSQIRTITLATYMHVP